MWLCSLFLALAFGASPQRLSTVSKDLSTSEKIYLKPGLAAVIEFPKPIIEVRIGNPANLKTSISTVSPKELTLFLESARAGATNLIVRSDRKIYVFDVIPSFSDHQDFIKIRGGYGAPGYTSESKILAFGKMEADDRNLKVRGRVLESSKLGVSR